MQKSKLSTYLENQHIRALVDTAIFGLIIIVFHFLWWNGGLHNFLLRSFAFRETEQFLVGIVFGPSAWIVDHILGLETKTIDTTLYFTNNSSVQVSGTCSGLKQFYQWIILMVLFPGPWKKKLWFIPMGIVVIHLFNVLRIIILDLIMSWNPQVWNFSHDWILRPFFYVVIFGMWMIWEEKFRLPSWQRKMAKKKA